MEKELAPSNLHNHKIPADLDVEDRGSSQGEKGESPTPGASPEIDSRLAASGQLEVNMIIATQTAGNEKTCG